MNVLSYFYPVVNFGILILIWLVQCIVYPSMRQWSHDRFTLVHSWYTKTITVFIVLLMPSQAALAIVDLTITDSLYSLLQLVAITISWLVTFLISVPIHNRLRLGYDETAIDRLIETNWIRTVAWSMVFLFDIIKLIGLEVS